MIMKYAMSSRQTPEYLKKADEIRVQYQDRGIIYDFIEKYPDKTYILELPYYIQEEDIDYNEIDILNRLCEHFMCRVSRINDIDKLRELEVKWFYGIIIDRWEDLLHLITTDTQYIVIGGDLFFNLKKIKKFNIPLRIAPNFISLSPLAEISEMDFDISIVGDWFQPEATKIYEEYIDTIEFEECTLQQERAFYRLWSHDGWPGNLTQIITNLKTEAQGRLINPEWFYTNRLDCGRTCLERNNIGCQLCYRQFILANYNLIKSYKDRIESKSEENT